MIKRFLDDWFWPLGFMLWFAVMIYTLISVDRQPVHIRPSTTAPIAVRPVPAATQVELHGELDIPGQYAADHERKQ